MQKSGHTAFLFLNCERRKSSKLRTFFTAPAGARKKERRAKDAKKNSASRKGSLHSLFSPEKRMQEAHSRARCQKRLCEPKERSAKLTARRGQLSGGGRIQSSRCAVFVYRTASRINLTSKHIYPGERAGEGAL